MRIPDNIIANADDLGYSTSVNKAILYCFEHGYINSTSLMTNTPFFEETVSLIRENPVISNIGVHVDLAEFKPVTDFKEGYLDAEGHWDVYHTNRASNSLDAAAKAAFTAEINAQIDKALSKNIQIIHLDSHLHLHTLPCFYKLFLATAQKYKLKLRLAQTYHEGSYLKYYYRKYINYLINKGDHNYSDRFETVERFLKHKDQLQQNIIAEVMLHPWFTDSGKLEDHFDPDTLTKWMSFLKNP